MRAPADTGASGILVLSGTSSWVTHPKRESGFCPRKRGIPDFLIEGEGCTVVGGPHEVLSPSSSGQHRLDLLLPTSTKACSFVLQGQG